LRQGRKALGGAPQSSNETHFDIWKAPVTYGPDGPKAGEPRPVLQTLGLGLFPNPSPDGKWVAFPSSEGAGDPYVYASQAAVW
jgi:hypothetical protein